MKKIIGIILFFLFLIVICIAIFFVLFPRKYEQYINVYADQYGLDRYLVASVINVESGYDSKAISHAGAVGLMQILPTTADDIVDRLHVEIDKRDLFDVETNIHLGCFYLSYLLEIFDGNVINTLCAYNWGLNNVRGWIEKGNCDSEGTITNIPVAETRNYLKKFKINKFVYQNIYGY